MNLPKRLPGRRSRSDYPGYAQDGASPGDEATPVERVDENLQIGGEAGDRGLADHP